MEKKYQCSKTMLNDIYQIFKKNKKEAFSVIIFVPEGMVSLLIGVAPERSQVATKPVPIQ